MIQSAVSYNEVRPADDQGHNTDKGGCLNDERLLSIH